MRLVVQEPVNDHYKFLMGKFEEPDGPGTIRCSIWLGGRTTEYLVTPQNIKNYILYIDSFLGADNIITIQMFREETLADAPAITATRRN